MIFELCLPPAGTVAIDRFYYNSHKQIFYLGNMIVRVIAQYNTKALILLLLFLLILSYLFNWCLNMQQRLRNHSSPIDIMNTPTCSKGVLFC